MAATASISPPGPTTSPHAGPDAGGEPVPVTVDLPGLRRDEVERVALARLESGGYRVTGRTAATVTVTRRRRPRWAVTLAVVLALPTAGVGLLLLRLRREELGILVLEDTVLGTRLQLSGDLPADLPGALSAALFPEPPRTVCRYLLWAQGELPLELTGPLVVGRTPEPTAAGPDLPVLAVEDRDGTISRSHALLGVDEQGVWVVDLGSRNGTELVRVDGERTRCLPGGSYPLPGGGTVLLAGTPLLVTTEPAAARRRRPRREEATCAPQPTGATTPE
jgi:hypothetical protein